MKAIKVIHEQLLCLLDGDISRPPRLQGHAKITVELIQDYDLKDMCRQYKRNLNSLAGVIVLTSHRNIDLYFNYAMIFTSRT